MLGEKFFFTYSQISNRSKLYLKQQKKKPFFSSILGMNLFGCKFCKTIQIKNEQYLQVECSRKNFDSLLWATITVFQVMNKKPIVHYP
jgi:hypothetical protein